MVSPVFGKLEIEGQRKRRRPISEKNETGAAININITPPPWKTWWAYSLYVIAAGAVVLENSQLESGYIYAGVPAKTCYLMYLRASQINGCGFCVDMHSRELRDIGETQELINTGLGRSCVDANQFVLSLHRSRSASRCLIGPTVEMKSINFVNDGRGDK